MEQLATIIGHLAWPVTAAVLGLLLVRELKAGLLGKALPNGGSFEAAGFKLQTFATKQSAKKAYLAVAEDVEIGPERGLSPYDHVMDAWRVLADAVTASAVRHGGVDDLRRINPNLETLRAARVSDPELLEGVSNLFQPATAHASSAPIRWLRRTLPRLSRPQPPCRKYSRGECVSVTTH